MNETMFYAMLGIAATVLSGGGFGLGWALKPHPLRGKMIMVARRPTSGTGLIKVIKPTRGIYTHSEKRGGDQEESHQDIHLDNAFLWDERNFGAKMIDVDLDSGHPIRYRGACLNDEEVVTITRKNGDTVELKELWRRLGGARLYAIRKDIRLKQLAAIGTGMWDFLTRVMPIVLIVIGIVLLIILGLFGFTIAKGG